MYKELFNFVQNEVKCIAEELDKHNFSQSKQMIEERLELLDILQRIQPLENKDDPDPESQTVEETLSVENEQSSTNEKDEIVNQSLYEFQRKAVGGELQSLSESHPSLFIPETVIRDLEIASGDIIQVDPTEVDGRYDFSLYKKINIDGIEPDRREFRYCIVEAVNDQLIVQQSALDGPIHIDGQEKSLFINDYTKEKFNLTEGSIVDVAYLMSEKKLQIVWRHNHNHSSHSFVTSPSSSSRSAKKESAEQTAASDPFEGKLKDKTVTIMGATETQENFKKLFGSAGINHQLLRGDESGVKISSAVRKSDAVIVITPFTESHAGSQQANKYCKEYNVPFRQSKTYGVKTITNLIKEMIV
ncbi:DUF2325 domain-containing protein [Bacillus paralicheniformis]|uniref:DUF2325 domain-containing protein n=1 Tax=Bacillus paralicheniformis TaxID=1648923 RepID=UPI0034D20302